MSGDHNMNQRALKKNISASKSIMLNREQIEKLWEIASNFKEINKFTVETDHTSGIGVGVVVKFDLFQKNDTQIDITDVKEW